MLRESITAVVGSWGPYASLCGVWLVAWKLWKQPLRNLATRLWSMLPRHRHARDHGLTRQWPVFFVGIWCAIMLFGATRLPKYSIVTEHHVAIFSRQDNGDFSYKSDEEPSGGSYRVCPDDIHNGVDTAAMLNQGVGFIADYAIWEERGTCKSIVRSDAGFWWKDEETNFQYVRIN